MNSRAITQDPSDSNDFSILGNAIYASYAPWLGGEAGGAASASQAAGAGSGSPGSVVAVAAGGITINLLFDAAAMAAPASFRAGIQQAASILAATISDQITVNLTIHYSGTGGGAFAGPDWGQGESYSSIRADLINNATPGDATFNALPGGSSVQGQSSVIVWNAQLKLWGLIGANDTTTDDGSATFATDINPNLLVGVALHELTHALGRIPYGAQPDIFDLFRFTSPGAQLFLDGATAPAAYFSVDGGYTKLADFGLNSDPSDFLNGGVQGPNDPFNEFYNGNTSQALTAVDKEMLDALGFHTAAPVVTTVLEAFGSTKLVQVGNNFFLDSVSSGTGPELKYQGAPVVANQGPFTPIGAEQTASGYDVAWKIPGADQYTVWSTDSSGNFISNLTGVVSGTSTILESLESTFHQDLNGDGLIGVPPPVVIESSGSTKLVAFGNNFYLDSVSSGVGPELKYQSAPIVAGQGPFTPIGAEQTASGYDVAWKIPGADQYTVWSTDSSGNFIANLTGVVSGSSAILESLESTFHQDLNGDGVIGVVSVWIETAGSTSLIEIGNQYLFGGASGPSLKSGGAAYVAGQYGGWAPIGVEATATGYEVAWKLAGADQYTIWDTDSSGNFLHNTLGGIAVSGTSATLESFESSFHQDLNGDGVIGIPTVVIETAGSTSLIEIGNQYFFGGAAGPSLKAGGVAYLAGQYGGWAPIGVEATATGYEVAWKVAGADQYTIWDTDSSGNYLDNTLGGIAVSGSSAILRSFESSFHQDLNGDGLIAVPGTVMVETSGSTSLVEIANNYYLGSNGGGLGPELKIGGVAYATGQYGAWAPIGAEATATGYEVAWKVTGADQYTVWYTDSSGNFVSNPVGLASGSQPLLESFETGFHQDLNGDGVIGVPAAASSFSQGPAMPAVTVANNDTFKFSPDFSAGAGVNAGHAGPIEFQGFSWLTKSAEWSTLLNDLHAGQIPASFQWAAGHESTINPDSMIHVHVVDPHANDYFLR